MRRGAGRITAPDEYQPAVDEHLRRWSQPSPDSKQYCLFSCMTTDGSLQAAGPQAIPEATISDRAVHQPESSRVAVRQDALRAMLSNDVTPASRDFRDGLVPRNAFKRAAAFGANTPHGIE